jgi:hypothetical protein
MSASVSTMVAFAPSITLRATNASRTAEQVEALAGATEALAQLVALLQQRQVR